MTHDKEKLQRYIKKILIILMVIGAIFLGKDSFWIDANQFSRIKDGTEEYIELENDVTYEMQYLCMAKKLDIVSCYIGNCLGNTGTITISVTDMNGEPVATERVYDLSGFNVEVLQIPTYMVQDTYLGKLYSFKLRVSGVDQERPLTIQCAKSVNAIASMKNSEAKLKTPIVLTYSGSDFFSIIYVRNVVVLFFIMVLLLLFRKKWVLTRRWEQEILVIITMICAVIIMEVATGNIRNVTVDNYAKNIFLVYILAKILGVFINNQRLMLTFITVFCFIAGTAECYLMRLRGTPLVPWDFKVLDTAVTVAGKYQYDIIIDILLAFELLVCCILVVSKFDVVIEKKNCYLEKGARIVWVLVCIVLFNFKVYPSLETNLWSIAETYRTQGTLTSFLAYGQYMKYEKPEGYSKKRVQKILDDVVEVKGNEKKAQNIIVIMNESFSDLRVINDQIISDEYMPFIDSLTDNVIKGNLYVSVFGGGTCNTEFEVLTGVSTRYTPPNPYVTSINMDMDSLCREFAEQGFQSFAFHPYIIENWNRNRVYPHLGFEQILSQVDMENPQYIRWCVGDRSNYEKVIEQYEINSSEPFFMFNVTMQNHGGYGEKYDNFGSTVDLSAQGEFPETETYLSLVKESDAAFEELVNYFQNVEEPTLICFFGDHQSSIEDAFYEDLYGKALGELNAEEVLKRYITPFVIWSNYDMESREIDKISANYLGSLIMKTAGYDLNGYDAFTYQLFEQYPVLSVNGIYDKAGTYYAHDTDLNDELLNEYECLQYYRMKTKY